MRKISRRRRSPLRSKHAHPRLNIKWKRMMIPMNTHSRVEEMKLFMHWYHRHIEKYGLKLNDKKIS